MVEQQVSRIKERVEEKEGIPPVQQRLIFGGKQMYVAHLHYIGGIFFVEQNPNSNKTHQGGRQNGSRLQPRRRRNATSGPCSAWRVSAMNE